MRTVFNVSGDGVELGISVSGSYLTAEGRGDELDEAVCTGAPSATAATTPTAGISSRSSAAAIVLRHSLQELPSNLRQHRSHCVCVRVRVCKNPPDHSPPTPLRHETCEPNPQARGQAR